MGPEEIQRIVSFLILMHQLHSGRTEKSGKITKDKCTASKNGIDKIINESWPDRCEVVCNEMTLTANHSKQIIIKQRFSEQQNFDITVQRIRHSNWNDIKTGVGILSKMVTSSQLFNKELEFINLKY